MYRKHKNSRVFAARINNKLAGVLDRKAAEYGLHRSGFVAALLEMVDDGDLYEQLLGPISLGLRQPARSVAHRGNTCPLTSTEELLVSQEVNQLLASRPRSNDSEPKS